MLLCFIRTTVKLSSPDGNIITTIALNTSGVLTYIVFNKDEMVIEPSKLGFNLSDMDFSKSLKVTDLGVSEAIIDSYMIYTDERSAYDTMSISK